MILGSELELKKVQTAASKHLRIFPKIRGGGNSAKGWVKTSSSETITGFENYHKFAVHDHICRPKFWCT